jgi:cell wall-associated NlpC family hydrolase
LHRLHDVSPCERFIQLAASFGSRGLFPALCFLVFGFFAFEAFAALENDDSGATPLACAVSTPESIQAPIKPKVQSAPKSKPARASKKKTGPAAQPLVSAQTKAKADAITAEMAPVLPSNLEQEISKFFGLRYRFGGEGRNGIDCSALVKQVYSDAFGVSLPRSSSEQSRLMNLDSVSPDDLKTGDLVFFGPKRKRVNHVGMYLAGGRFLHAARTEGVTISSLDDGYWKSRFMFSKRMRGLDLLEDADDEGDFHRDLMRDSLAFTVDSDDSEVSFLNFGAQVNDSIELMVSGFFLSSLEENGPPDPLMAAADRDGSESSEGEAGFRLAAILSPLEWFKLIPSVTQIESSQAERKRERDYQKLGLETWMFLPTSRMAVFMAAHARNQEDLFERPLDVSPDWQTMDMALGLHYHLSDSLRFSLWGTHAYNPDIKAAEDAGRRNAPVDEMSFQMNLRF